MAATSCGTSFPDGEMRDAPRAGSVPAHALHHPVGMPRRSSSTNRRSLSSRTTNEFNRSQPVLLSADDLGGWLVDLLTGRFDACNSNLRSEGCRAHH
jgi:hypothetical protein